jgi:hypothetical protein
LWSRNVHNAGELHRVAAYASDLDHLLRKYRSQIAVWIHGHIHTALDYAHEGIRIVSNPRGYPYGIHGAHRTDAEKFEPEVYRFNPSKVVDSDQGMAPPLEEDVRRTLGELDPIVSETDSFSPYAGHADPKVRVLATSHIERLAGQYNAVLRRVLAPLALNLWTTPPRDADDILHAGPMSDWAAIFGVRRLAITDVFYECSPLGNTQRPAEYAQNVVDEMHAVRDFLQERIPQVVWGARYSIDDIREMRGFPRDPELDEVPG